MSTQTQSFSTLTAIPERRFYPRIAPQAPIFFVFSENMPEDSLLLNVSENGLLVSSRNRLTSNFVTRLSLPLRGLPKPVQVTVRVVWASEAQNLAGIQLLDLSEHDRQQIRTWASRESAPSSLPATDDPLSASTSSAPYPEPDLGSENVSNIFAENSSSDTSTAIVPLAEPQMATKRPASAAPRRAFLIALVAAACLAGTVLLIKAAPRIPFPMFSEYRRPPSIAADTLENNVQPISASPISVPPTNPVNAKPDPPAATAAPAPSTIPNKPKAPASTAPAKPEPPRIEPATADTDEADSADASEDQHADSPSEASSSAPPETAPAAPAPSESAAVAPAHSASAKPLPAADPKGPDAVPPVTPSATTTIPPSSPTAAHARPTLSPRPAAPAPQPVIQMDVPPTRSFEVHLPSGYQAPYFSLPGERVLESPTLTTHIQRSVHMPATHAGWPFHRNKKVVVGELISRVDPPPVQISSGTDASVRVKAAVTKDGRVENVKLILGPQNLLPAVSQALRQWRYQPTLVDGNPVETQCSIVFQFHAKSYRAAKR